jgi:threonine aldolase
MSRLIDLRSDVFAAPTEEMWAAMRAAEVGWAYFGQDPSVNRLEALAAETLGKQAALFVPSCTTANLVALITLAPRGSRVVMEAAAHTATGEAAGLASVAGIVPVGLGGEQGRLSQEALAAALGPGGPGAAGGSGAGASVLCLENTHNTAGGTILTPAQTDALAETAHRHGLRVHLDGARLFNAAVALGEPAARLVAGADTVAISLNKGLGAPFGAVLAGPERVIAEARRHLHVLGVASIHQLGILAAAGIVALTSGVARLAEDNRRALTLARRLADLPGLHVDLDTVQTNIVAADVSPTGRSAQEFAARLAEHGVLAYPRPPHRVRFVTHRQIGDAEIGRAFEAVAAVVT